MLTILMGRAKTGKSEQVLRRIKELGDSSQQILLVPEHASHQAEVDLCRFCGDTASRHAEVLSFRRLCDQCNVAAAEHGENCFRLGLRCGLLLMADAHRPGREG